MPKISIIIPVYNTEKYLSKCLDSVINQTLKDIEIICINNGSTDNSTCILNKYALNDKRIILKNLSENVGVSKARNIGIIIASGKYIGFLDSDDFVDFDFYKKLYKVAEENNADAAKGNIYNYDVNTNTIELTDFYNINDKIRKNKAYFYYGFTSAIYKKSFLDKFDIRFPEGIKYFEDPYFSVKACINYKKLVFDDSAKYYYAQYNQNSVSNHATIANFNDFKNTGLQIIEILNATNMSKISYNIIFKFLLNFALSNYNNELLNSENKEYLLEIIISFLLSAKYKYKIPEKILQRIKSNINKGKYFDLLSDNYKKYDFLNIDIDKVKIFVSYIKPSFLFKTKILTPVHLGRTVEKRNSKDGVASDNDIKWLHDNCIGDDDFAGNISYLNRRVGFLTGTYWAWKNYERLGNPKYFGSMGYRKLLYPCCLENIDKYDFILPEKTKFSESIKSQFIKCHGKNYYDITLDAVEHCYKEEITDVEKYFNKRSGYFAEMYILNKTLFFEFCEWIFELLKYLINSYSDGIPVMLKKTKIDILLSQFTGKNIRNFHELKQANTDIRDVAFILERLSGYYFYKLTQNKNLKYKESPVFEPVAEPPGFVDYRYITLEKMRKNIKANLYGDNS